MNNNNQKDENIMLNLVGKSSDSVKSNYEIELDKHKVLVSEFGGALRNVPNKLKTRELCMIAVSNHGMALRYVPKGVISEEICVAAVSNNGSSIKYVPEELLSRKVCDIALNQEGLAIKYLPVKKITEKRALNSVKNNGLALEYIPLKLCNNNLYKESVNENGLSLEFVPSKNKTKKVCEIAVKNNPLSLEFVPNRFKSVELLEDAYKITWQAFRYYPSSKFTIPNCKKYLERLLKFKGTNGDFDWCEKNSAQETINIFPETVNNNLEIIHLERQLLFREITKKIYDEIEKKFIVEEKIYYDKTIITYKFNRFDQFYSMLHGDLSKADLSKYDFDNIDLKKYDIEGAIISSAVLINKGIYDGLYHAINVDGAQKYLDQTYSKENEEERYLSNVNITGLNELNLHKYKRKFYYISDLHLDHKISEKFPNHATKNEIKNFVNEIVSEIAKCGLMSEIPRYFNYLLIAGDVSFNYEISKLFYTLLVETKVFSNIVVVLGNHELWHYNMNVSKYPDIVNEFRSFFIKLGIKFLQNDLLLIGNRGDKIISEREINEIDEEELKKICLKSTTSIYGGIGFSAYNKEFNAVNGLYRDVVQGLEEDKRHTERFNKGYSKIKSALSMNQVIVLTHMPKENWSTDGYVKGWRYVNGHTHLNKYINDDERIIYADNQIGYYKNFVELKYFQLSRTYDIFRYYLDGKYEINKEQYVEFNRSLGIDMQFNQYFEKIIMLKRKGIYCFFVKDKGKLKFLEGGKDRKIQNQNIDYYYNNMVKYSNLIKWETALYVEVLLMLSKAVKLIGGSGSIHGFIVDIDFYNHIRLDPSSMVCEPYFATDQTKRLVYKDVGELLLNHNRDLYERYLLEMKVNNTDISILNKSKYDMLIGAKLEQDTRMYRASNLMRKYQYLRTCNIIRHWDETILSLIENNNMISEEF